MSLILKKINFNYISKLIKTQKWMFYNTWFSKLLKKKYRICSNKIEENYSHKNNSNKGYFNDKILTINVKPNIIEHILIKQHNKQF